MNCAEVQELLPALLYGDLEPAAKAGVESHLAQCATCREEQAALAATRQALGMLPAPTVRVDVARVYQHAAATQERAARRWRRLTVALAAVAAAILVLFVVRLEIRVEGHQLVVHWASPPPEKRPQESVRVASSEVTAADLKLVKDLIHALAAEVAEIDAREGQYWLALSGLGARLDRLQRQAQDRWDATQRIVSLLHTAQVRRE
jgi:hypothetical protein